MDEPLVWYEGSTIGASNRRYLATDERGSVVAVVDNAGTLMGINTYGPYGEPEASNLGRFGYTGQTWIPELGLNYYKARFYAPELGRFLQTDPIGYADGLNMYAYVGGDPVNYVDPLGLCLREIQTGWIHHYWDYADGSSSRRKPSTPVYQCLDQPTDPATPSENDGPGPDGRPGGGPPIPCPANPGTKFNSALEAGIAAARAAEAMRDFNSDRRREYGARIIPLPGGGHTFSKIFRSPIEGQITFRGSSGDTGWMHLHNRRDGESLSTEDHEMTRELVRETRNSDFITILVESNKYIYSWEGTKGLKGNGTNQGLFPC